MANMCVLLLYHQGRGEHVTICTYYMEAFYEADAPELKQSVFIFLTCASVLNSSLRFSIKPSSHLHDLDDRSVRLIIRDYAS